MSAGVPLPIPIPCLLANVTNAIEPSGLGLVTVFPLGLPMAEDDAASKSITNGSRIQVAIDSKGKASLVETPDVATTLFIQTCKHFQI